MHVRPVICPALLSPSFLHVLSKSPTSYAISHIYWPYPVSERASLTVQSSTLSAPQRAVSRCYDTSASFPSLSLSLIVHILWPDPDINMLFHFSWDDGDSMILCKVGNKLRTQCEHPIAVSASLVSDTYVNPVLLKLLKLIWICEGVN